MYEVTAHGISLATKIDSMYVWLYLSELSPQHNCGLALSDSYSHMHTSIVTTTHRMQVESVLELTVFSAEDIDCAVHVPDLRDTEDCQTITPHNDSEMVARLHLYAVMENRL